jgi:hypothetical protein
MSPTDSDSSQPLAAPAPDSGNAVSTSSALALTPISVATKSIEHHLADAAATQARLDAVHAAAADAAHRAAAAEASAAAAEAQAHAGNDNDMPQMHANPMWAPPGMASSSFEPLLAAEKAAVSALKEQVLALQDEVEALRARSLASEAAAQEALANVTDNGKRKGPAVPGTQFICFAGVQKYKS